MEKVSFSISKPQPTAKTPPSSASGGNIEEESSEFITVFDASEGLPSLRQQIRIIPPNPNEWAPSNYYSATGNAQSSSAGPSVENGIANALKYGLNLGNNGDARAGLNPAKSTVSDPSLIKLREDLERRPEINGFDEFEQMPVEEFGRALLAGYGWVEGMGIGRNAKEDAKVAECKNWTSRQGLGFSPTPNQN
ncbi:OLC1v1031224C1 [Oldenlandia corymbosa var. corymbosa]|uniref:OLC1v1031224C1 n=1 Tax=Oldenlandia corymbosa var. corymbosa TaxID=529605 RepID=A0AAV1CJS7_OLDCO|nr:OLC1v1031224C1 [Oldenlandia corymbosa var. corymbosa]